MFDHSHSVFIVQKATTDNLETDIRNTKTAKEELQRAPSYSVLKTVTMAVMNPGTPKQTL
jgi:hypothetical protein